MGMIEARLAPIVAREAHNLPLPSQGSALPLSYEPFNSGDLGSIATFPHHC